MGDPLLTLGTTINLAALPLALPGIMTLALPKLQEPCIIILLKMIRNLIPELHLILGIKTTRLVPLPGSPTTVMATPLIPGSPFRLT
jgi:hypothetical protein